MTTGFPLIIASSLCCLISHGANTVVKIFPGLSRDEKHNLRLCRNKVAISHLPGIEKDGIPVDDLGESQAGVPGTSLCSHLYLMVGNIGKAPKSKCSQQQGFHTRLGR